MNTKVDTYEYVATLHVDGKPEEIHYFRVPKSSEGGDWYRSLTSLNCFRRREMKWFGSSKCFDPKTKPPRFRTTIDFVHEFHNPVYSLVRALAKLAPPKEFRHDSVWEMYTAIGYDYKKQRYIRDGKTQGTTSNLQQSDSVSEVRDGAGIQETKSSKADALLVGG